MRGVRILLVEDDPDDAALVEANLYNGRWQAEVTVVDSRSALAERLEEPWDLVISDHTLPGFGAEEALALLKTRQPELPFIVVSGCLGEEEAVALMRAGARDCLAKQRLDRLLPVVERELREADNRRFQRLQEQALHRLAYFDDHTGLPNRRRFLQLLGERLDGPAGEEMALFHLGFDRVRLVSDALGEEAGNELVQAVADRLGELLPENAPLAHTGAEEFAFLVPAAFARDGWLDRLSRAFHRPFNVRRHELFATPSIGVALTPEHGLSSSALLRAARTAMLRCRIEQAAHVFYRSELEQESLEYLRICDRLRHAVQRGDFELHYQPKIDLARGGVIGAEALLRWNDAELGPVSPARFISLAEESGEIVPIGNWVLRAACEQAARWRRQGLPGLPIAVNVSVRQLHEPGLAEAIAELLAEMDLPPWTLELEVTESAIMADPQRAAASLGALRGMGIAIAVDDFGTGYSSLGYLKRLPISTLKVDRSFIVDAVEDAESRAIVQAIVGLARSLRLSVVAEGVETPAHARVLGELGCDQAQGYLYSRPLPVVEFERFLDRYAGPGPTVLYCGVNQA